MSRTDGRSTADGHEVKRGLIVWDNNLDICIVVAEHGEPSHGVQWWDMLNAVTGRRSPMQDGTRMGVWFPGLGTARLQLRTRYLEVLRSGAIPDWADQWDEQCAGCLAVGGYLDDGSILREHADDCVWLLAVDEVSA
jgi:hypothetical protein